jgi:hypothetical protein
MTEHGIDFASVVQRFLAALDRFLQTPWHALLVSILIELGAIWFTVSVIERRAKQREQRRWKPSRDQLYASVYGITERLLQDLVPARLVGRGDFRLYLFGGATTFVGIELDGQQVTAMPADILRDPQLVTAQELQRATDSVSGYQTELATALEASRHLDEPDLCEMLQSLQNAMAWSRAAIDVGTPDPFPFTGVLFALVGLRTWLEGKADKVYSTEDVKRWSEQTMKSATGDSA